MTEYAELCNLDYLTGTLATAYKGVITSLVAKDFCMTESEGTITLRGTILSMPEGRYRALLIHGGAKVSESPLRGGDFELQAAGETIRGAKNLQIDIVQNGRHVGTFLLKREGSDGVYMPAMELSEELRGVNLNLLTTGLRGKPGLLERAERIVSEICSTKKDWRKLSEEVHSLATDLFWSDTQTFTRCFELFTRFSLYACERGDAAFLPKMTGNFLDLIELPLEKEKDGEMLKLLAGIWLDAPKKPSADFTYAFTQVRRVIARMRERVPGADVSTVLIVLVNSLKARARKWPTIADSVLESLTGLLPEADIRVLLTYREDAKREFEKKVAEVEAMVRGERFDEAVREMAGTEFAITDEEEMIKAFFGAIEKGLTRDSAGSLIEIVGNFLSISGAVSAGAFGKMRAGVSGLGKKLLDIDRADLCWKFLILIEKKALPSKEEVFLDVDLAASILRSGDNELLRFYRKMLADIVLPAPKIRGFSSDTWAEMVDPLHIERLTRFMRIIELDTVRLRSVLIHLICNIYIGGVFIPDDRIFQREASAYLNCDTFTDNLFLNSMLLRALPVYYNEIGATGRVRDYTTEIDSWGNDPLLYFLRKQVHVNASNNNIRLTGEIIGSWVNGDPENLKDLVPGDVFERIDAALLGEYSPVIRELFRSLGVIDAEGLHGEKLLRVSEGELREGLKKLSVSEEVTSKIFLLCRIYQEIELKYAMPCGPEEAGEREDGLARLLGRLRELKKTITSGEKTRPEESLYFKRHIAFGIPSVMGSYHETKFDAFGESVRLEEKARVVLEKIIADAVKSKRRLSAADLTKRLPDLEDADGLLDIQGLANFRVDELLVIFRTNRLRLSQIADMLRMWQTELSWLMDFFYRTFHGPLVKVLGLCREDELPDRLARAAGGADFIDKATDLIIRDMVNGLAGFTELDRLLEALLQATGFTLESGRDEGVGTPDGAGVKRDYFVLTEMTEGEAMRVAPLIGGKAKNLVYLHNRGLRVPQGVVFPSDRTGNYREYTEGEAFGALLRKAVGEIEERTGRIFGRRQRPLFLSVRSGSYMSMPGILSSVLYCGMNQTTLKGFMEDTGDPRLCWDSYRRFLENYAGVVHGIDRKFFDDAFGRILKKRRVEKRAELDAEGMEEAAVLYGRLLADAGAVIPDDVYDQLKEAVKAVYGSWYGEKAVQFRKALNVSDHWGTSVTLMQMVYGNRKGSGASVFFTRRPFTLEKGVYGETQEGVTGADVVYGESDNAPLSRQQAVRGVKSLEENDSELFLMHKAVAERIEEAMGGLPQEVEVTYTSDARGERVIYVLQTRRMEFHRGFTRRFDDVCRMGSKIIGRGTGVHGGALSGVATFASSAGLIRQIKARSGMPVILIRNMASTADVSLMSEVKGILTSTGGVASHASVLAQKFDLSAVVGCTDMEIGEDERGNPYAFIGGYLIAEGAPISIDGSTGLVYAGHCMVTSETAPY